MGRITVFAADEINSLTVLKALESRKLPFSRVAVDADPSRITDAKALSGKSSVPRVFFNTRPVGGIDETLQELTRWDLSGSVVEKYEEEIQTLADPVNPKLAPTSATDESPPARIIVPLLIELPDRTRTSFHDIAEKLKNSLEPSEVKHKGVVYKKAFLGIHAVGTMQKSMSFAQEAAIAFCDKLIEAGVMHRLPLNGSRGEMECSNDAVYRLQCDATPKILNSYRLRPLQEEPVDALDALSSLDAGLRRIEIDSASSSGLLDCAQALAHNDFPKFEEMTSVLQVIDFRRLKEAERLPFCLNLHHIMMRYAFIKIGIPIYDSDRLHFMENVEFMVSGHTFSFREWIDGLLRGNAKSPAFNKVPFKEGDGRQELVLKGVNPLFHFALNSGPHVGTRTSVPFLLYSADRIDQQLKLAAEAFWEDEANFQVDQKAGVVRIPLTLASLKDDLPESSMITDYVEEYLTATQRSALRNLGGKPKVSFAETNWARNYSKFARYDKEAILSEKRGLQALISRFRKPKLPENEKLRLATVRRMNILDTLPEERFDRITRRAQESFASACVVMTFVEDQEYFVKSSQLLGGSANTRVPSRSKRDSSFCGHTILEEDKMMIVPDTQQDDRFADNPRANAMGFRFYAGAAVSVPSGENGENVNIGTLCVFDRKPRHFSGAEKSMLTQFAKEIETEVQRNPAG